MALLVQNPEGLIEHANGYTTVAAVRAYALDRGDDLTAINDTDLGAAIVRATDFMDAAFTYIGTQKNIDQGTQWPRSYTHSRYAGLPRPILDACCKLAARAARGTSLFVDPTVDPSGQNVSSKTTKVGPIETSVAFFGPPGDAAKTMSQRFPEVEAALRAAGLLQSRLSGQLGRA